MPAASTAPYIPESMKILPNLLSWSRIILAPVIAIVYFLGHWGAFAALVIFIIAAVTDYLDGKIARDHDATNSFGTFLDPVADKILVICVLMLLVAEPAPSVNRLLLGVLAALVILREVVQSSLRDWMAQEGKSADVAVTTLSKTKTALQLVSLGILISHPTVMWITADTVIGKFAPFWISWIGVVMLAVAVVLGYASLYQFLRAAFGKGK